VSSAPLPHAPASSIPHAPTPPVFTQTVRGPFSWFATAVGKKVVMALTGAFLFGFTIAHMIGNLQVFLGAHAMNEYGVWLRELGHGAVLWALRGALLLAAALHVWAAVSLTSRSRGARPAGYRRRRFRQAGPASRSMVWGGVALALFIVYHLMHLTFGNAHPDFRHGDVYHNLTAGFRAAPVSIAYLAAMGALGMHLYHGSWSFTQTLGWSHPRYDGLRRGASAALALAVTAGFAVVPIAILFGWVR
jgi:succinate dehydrogenase / fumarate reductase cytochrome b subunit